MNSSSIDIRWAALHIVDPHGPGGFQLSDRELALDDAVKLFFRDHISRSLADPAAKGARFDGRKSPLKSVVGQWRQGKRQLLELSREAAQLLYSIVREDRRISGSVVAVCESEDETGTSLGLLKLDPSRAFRPRVQKTPQGTYVELESLQNVVPSSGDRLQKCAFFPRKTTRLGHDMVVLDRQASGEETAQFFTEKFLCAIPHFDDRELTQRFYDTVLTSYNDLRATLSRTQADHLRDSLEAALQQESLDVDQWVETRRLPKSTKQVLRSALHLNLPAKTFKLDEPVAQKLTRVRKFRGDGGFVLVLNSSVYDQVMVEPPSIVFDEKDGAVTRIRLRVAHLREEGQ